MRPDSPDGGRRPSELDGKAGSAHQGEVLSAIKDKAYDVDRSLGRDELHQGPIDAAVRLALEVFGSQQRRDDATHNVVGSQQRAQRRILGAEAMGRYPSMDDRWLPRELSRSRAARAAVQRMASS